MPFVYWWNWWNVFSKEKLIKNGYILICLFEIVLCLGGEGAYYTKSSSNSGSSYKIVSSSSTFYMRHVHLYRLWKKCGYFWTTNYSQGLIKERRQNIQIVSEKNTIFPEYPVQNKLFIPPPPAWPRVHIITYSSLTFLHYLSISTSFFLSINVLTFSFAIYLSI